MKFNAREDIDVAIEEVWPIVSDYEAFERIGTARGVKVVRKPGANPLEWNVGFVFKGRKREVSVRLDEEVPPNLLRCSGKGKAVDFDVQVDIVRLSAKRTRLILGVEVRPNTLAARLFLQSLKLTKGRVVKKFESGVSDLARMIEARAKGAKPTL